MLDPFNSPWRPSKELFTPVETPRAGHAPAPPERVPVTAPALPEGPVDFNTVVSELEKKLIAAALETCRGHQKKAAEHLGLSYHQMRGLLRKYGYGRDGASVGPESGNAGETETSEN
jgi:psp operon transcriptional activator